MGGTEWDIRNIMNYTILDLVSNVIGKKGNYCSISCISTVQLDLFYNDVSLLCFHVIYPIP